MCFSWNINNGFLCSVNWLDEILSSYTFDFINLLYNKNLMSPLLFVGIQWMSGPQEGGGEGAVRALFWRQKTFLFVSIFRKLIVHENLYLKLFCSSKIVDFRAVFSKFSAVQPYFLSLLPHIYDLAPLFSNASCGPGCWLPMKGIVVL